MDTGTANFVFVFNTTACEFELAVRALSRSCNLLMTSIKGSFSFRVLQLCRL